MSDAVVAGKARRLNLIATAPTDVQMAQGNHALELEFIDVGDGPPVEFDNHEIEKWGADCSDKLYEAVYNYFSAFIEAHR